MDCHEAVGRISRFIDGELPDSDVSAMFQHLAACARCREFLRGVLALREHLDENAWMPRHQAPSPIREINAHTVPGLRPRALTADRAVRAARVLTRPRRVSLSVLSFGLLVVAVAAVSALVTLGALPAQTGMAPPQREIVVVTTLPTVDVTAVPTSNKGGKERMQ